MHMVVAVAVATPLCTPQSVVAVAVATPLCTPQSVVAVAVATPLCTPQSVVAVAVTTPLCTPQSVVAVAVATPLCTPQSVVAVAVATQVCTPQSVVAVAVTTQVCTPQSVVAVAVTTQVCTPQSVVCFVYHLQHAIIATNPSKQPNASCRVCLIRYCMMPRVPDTVLLYGASTDKDPAPTWRWCCPHRSDWLPKDCRPWILVRLMHMFITKKTGTLNAHVHYENAWPCFTCSNSTAAKARVRTAANHTKWLAYRL